MAERALWFDRSPHYDLMNENAADNLEEDPRNGNISGACSFVGPPLNHLLSENQKKAQTLWTLASLHQRNGEFDHASACIRQIVTLEVDPDQVGAGLLAIGQIEESRGDYAAAAKRYGEALAFEPCSQRTWYLIHNNLGFSLNQLGNHLAAKHYLETAIRIDPRRANAYKNLGLAHEAIGEIAEAAKLFIKATEVQPRDLRAFNHLFRLLEAKPDLTFEIPDLQAKIVACREAIQATWAPGLQPPE